jgi:hypothetical protein
VIETLYKKQQYPTLIDDEPCHIYRDKWEAYWTLISVLLTELKNINPVDMNSLTYADFDKDIDHLFVQYDLAESFKTLSKSDWLVLHAYIYRGKSFKEIDIEAGQYRGWAKNSFNRARRQLLRLRQTRVLQINENVSRVIKEIPYKWYLEDDR